MSDLKTKSFFEKPEGKTGIIFMIAAVGALLYGLYYFLPFFLTILTNTLHAMILMGVIAAIVFVVADPRFRTLLWYFYKSAMRWITGLFITIDPIGILKGYAEDLREKKEDMEKNMATLDGEKRKLKAQIDKNEADRKQSLGIAKQAHAQGAQSKAAFVFQARKAGRLEKSNMTLQGLYNQMDKMSRVLRKMHESSEFMLQDIESEVDVKEREYKAIKASYGAFASAKRIIDGDGDKREMFDMAMEHLTNDYHQKIGEIDLFMDMSKGFIQSVDLENGVYEQDALDKFAEWEKTADSLLLGETPARVVTPEQKLRVNTPMPFDRVSSDEAEEASSSFDDLFNQK